MFSFYLINRHIMVLILAVITAASCSKKLETKEPDGPAATEESDDTAQVEKFKKLYTSYLTCSAKYKSQFSVTNALIDSRTVEKKCRESEVSDYILKINSGFTDFQSSYQTMDANWTLEYLKEKAYGAQEDMELIAKDYNSLLELSSYCREKYLTDVNFADPTYATQYSMVYPVDTDANKKLVNDLFGHISDTSFVNKEQFKSADFGKLLDQRLFVLERLEDKLKHEFIKDREQTDPCADLNLNLIPAGDIPKIDIPKIVATTLKTQATTAKELWEESRNKARIGEFTTKLGVALGGLTPGSSLFFPSGMSKNSFVFEITREQMGADLFRLRIYNNSSSEGDGIPAYFPIHVADTIQYLPFVEVREVPLVNIKDDEFIVGLYEVGEDGAKNAKADFFEKVIPYLGGKRTDFVASILDLVDVKTGGSSGYASMISAMATSAGRAATGFSEAEKKALGVRFLDLIDSITFKDYTHLVEDGKLKDLAQYERAISSFASRYSNDYVQGVSDEGKLQSNVEVAKKAKELVKEEIKKVRADEKTTAPKFNPKADLPAVASTAVRQIPQSTPDTIVGGAKIDTRKSKFVSNVDEISTANALGIYNKLPKLYKKIKKLVTNLVDWNFDYTLAAEYVSDIARQLKLSSADWPSADLTSDQAISVIEQLAKLNELYFYCLVHDMLRGNLRKSAISAKQLLVSVKLLAVADLLNRTYLTEAVIKPQIGSFTEAKGIGPNLYQDTFTKYIFGDSAVFELRDPIWLDQLEKIKTFYAPQWNSGDPQKGSFFELEKYTSSTTQGTTLKYNDLEDDAGSMFQWALKYAAEQGSLDATFVDDRIAAAKVWETAIKGAINNKYAVNDSGWQRDTKPPYDWKILAPVALHKTESWFVAPAVGQYNGDPVIYNPGQAFERFMGTFSYHVPDLGHRFSDGNPANATRVNDKVIQRKNAAMLLAGMKNLLLDKGELDLAPTGGLPKVFFDLQSLSVVTDYLLTGEFPSTPLAAADLAKRGVVPTVNVDNKERAAPGFANVVENKLVREPRTTEPTEVPFLPITIEKIGYDASIGFAFPYPSVAEIQAKLTELFKDHPEILAEVSRIANDSLQVLRNTASSPFDVLVVSIAGSQRKMIVNIVKNISWVVKDYTYTYDIDGNEVGRENKTADFKFVLEYKFKEWKQVPAPLTIEYKTLATEYDVKRSIFQNSGLLAPDSKPNRADEHLDRNATLVDMYGYSEPNLVDKAGVTLVNHEELKKNFTTEKTKSKVTATLFTSIFNSGYSKFEKDQEGTYKWNADYSLPQTRNRIKENKLVQKDIKNEYQYITLQRFRQLAGISSERELQMVEVLGFFSDQQELLKDPQYQAMFKKLLLETSLLHNSLGISRINTLNFVKKLGNFFQKNFDVFNTKSDHKTVGFILLLSKSVLDELVYELVTRLKPAVPLIDESDIRDAFLKTPNELVTLIASEDVKKMPDVRRFYYRTLAQSFVNSGELDKNEVAFLLAGVSGMNKIGTSYQKDSWKDEFSETEVKNILVRHRKSIIKALTPPVDRDMILDKACKIALDIDITTQRGANHWNFYKLSLPIERARVFYVTVGTEPMELDIVTGVWHRDSQPITKGSINEEAHNKIFPANYYGKRKNSVSRFGDEQYVIEAADNEVFKQDGTKVKLTIFHNSFSNTWQQKRDTGMPGVAPVYELMSDEKVKDRADSFGFFPGYDHWQKISNTGVNTDPAPDPMIVEVRNKKTKEVEYESEFSQNGQQLKKVRRLADEKCLVNLYNNGEANFGLIQNEFKAFYNIEDARHIYIWHLCNDTLSDREREVHLPRLDLTFKFHSDVIEFEAGGDSGRKDEYYDCGTRFSGYRIAEKAYLDAFGNPENYLVCEPSPQKFFDVASASVKERDLIKKLPKKVIVVRQEILSDGGVAKKFTSKTKAGIARGDFKYDPESKVFSTQDYSGDVLVYDVEDRPVGAARDFIGVPSGSGVGRYYLALRYLWQREHKLAHDIIYNFQVVGKLKESEKEILQWLINAERLPWTDNTKPPEEGNMDPEAWGIRLKALATLMADEKDPKEGKDDDYSKAFVDLYLKYIPASRNLSRNWIERRLELGLADRINRYYAAVHGSSKERKRVADRELLKLRLTSLRADANALNGDTAVAQAPNETEYIYENIKDYPRNFESEVLKNYAESKASFLEVPATVTNPSAIFTEGNFDTLYEAATNGPLWTNGTLLAQGRGLLLKIYENYPSVCAKINAWTADEVRQKLIGLMQKGMKVEQNKSDVTSQIARFLYLASRAPASSSFLSAAELKAAYKSNKDAGITISTNDKKIADLRSDISNRRRTLPEMIDYQDYWSNPPLNTTPGPGKLRYENAKTRYEQEQKDNTRDKDKIKDLEDENDIAREAMVNAQRDVNTRVTRNVTDAENSETPSVDIRPAVSENLTKKTTGGIAREELIAGRGIRGEVNFSKVNDPLISSYDASNKLIVKKIFRETPFSKTIDLNNDVNSLFSILNLAQASSDVMPSIKELKDAISDVQANVVRDEKTYVLEKAEEMALPASRAAKLAAASPDFKLLRDNVEAEIRTWNTKKSEAAAAALKAAKQTPSQGSGLNARNLMVDLAINADDLEINDLLYILVSNKLEKFYQVLLPLDKVQLERLTKSLGEYLVASTYLQHLIKISKAIEDVIDAPKDLLVANELVSLLTAKRNYAIAAHPQYLVFEHFMDMMLRSNQVKALDDLMSTSQVEGKKLGTVVELIMGAGKTAVVMPLLAMLNLEKSALNIVMLPEALLPSMSLELAERLGRGFNKAIQVLEIKRETQLDENGLRSIYVQLEDAHRNATTIVTSNSSMQSLFLTLIDRLGKYAAGEGKVEQEIVELRNIFVLLKKYGALTIDEIDLALDVLQAHQFSVGGRVSVSDQHEAVPATVLSMYALIAGDKALYSEIKFPFLAHYRANGEAFSEETYKKKFKGLLIDKLLALDSKQKSFIGENFDAIDKVYSGFIKTPKNRDAIKHYWTSKDIIARQECLALIDAVVVSFDSQTILKDIVTTLYTEINDTLVTTASKKLGDSYGALPAPNKKDYENETDAELEFRREQWELNNRFIAIPYAVGNPKLNSRFGSAIESLNYTIQKELQERNYFEHVRREIEALRKMPENDDFIKRFNLVRSGTTTKSIGLIDEEDINEMVRDIQDNAKDRVAIQVALIKAYTVPQITTYPMQLQTNAQIYGPIMNTVDGMTATTWSMRTFADIFKNLNVGASGVTAKVFLRLWRQAIEFSESYGFARGTVQPIQQISKSISKSNGVEELSGDKLLARIVEQVFPDAASATKSNPKWYGSVIDEGGMFSGFSNEKVSSALLARARSIEPDKTKLVGIIFYDDKGDLVTLGNPTTEGGKAAPMVGGKRLVGYIVYWDRAHTTGSDVKIAVDAEAKVSSDRYTKSRDFAQAVGRMREVEKGGQKIRGYLVFEEDVEVMRKLFSEKFSGLNISKSEFNLAHLFLYIVSNQVFKLGDLRYRALTHKLRSAVIDPIIEVWRDKTLTVSALGEIYKKVADLFERHEGLEAWRGMGIPSSEQNKEVVASFEKSKILDRSYMRVFKDSDTYSYFSPDIIKLITTRMDNTITEELKTLPARYVVSGVESGMELEVEMEVHQELEVETEKETENETTHHDIKQQPNEQEAVKWPVVTESNKAADFDTKRETVFTDTYFRSYSHGFGKGYSGPDTPVAKLGESLGAKGVSILNTAMDNRLLVSFNFAPVHAAPTDKGGYFQFFGVYDKALTQILIVQSTTNENDIQMVLLDKQDAVEWEKFLIDDAAMSPAGGARQKRIALAQLYFGAYLFDRSFTESDMAKLETLEAYKKLKVQLKYFQGVSKYSEKAGDDEEKKLLSDWIEKMPGGYENAKRQFMDQILFSLDENRRKFKKGSDLWEIFEQLKIKAAN